MLSEAGSGWGYNAATYLTPCNTDLRIVEFFKEISDQRERAISAER
jgi:hypothetical protein